jgi:hypothetical protein
LIFYKVKGNWMNLSVASAMDAAVVNAAVKAGLVIWHQEFQGNYRLRFRVQWKA